MLLLYFGQKSFKRQCLLAQEDCRWSSASGSKVQLTDVNLDELSRPESLSLQHISLAKLRKFHLRSDVVLPKGTWTLVCAHYSSVQTKAVASFDF